MTAFTDGLRQMKDEADARIEQMENAIAVKKADLAQLRSDLAEMREERAKLNRALGLNGDGSERKARARKETPE